jgi:hypothetical protein
MRFSRLHVPSFLGGGACALTAVFMWLALFALFSGGAKPQPPRPTPMFAPGQPFPAPFEFEVISVELEGRYSGPTATVKLRTGEVVANKATRPELTMLWWHLRPSIEERIDMMIEADPTNPLVWGGRHAVIELYRHDELWAVITRTGAMELTDYRKSPRP